MRSVTAIFAVTLVVGSLQGATQSSQGSSAPTPASTASAGLAKTMSANRKPAMRLPASLMPPPQARPSTAQAGPLRAGWKPVREMPALQLTSVDGKTATLSSTGKPRHWLLIYRHADCLPCDRLMLSLAASTSPELKKGEPFVVLIDSAQPDALETVRQNFTGFSQATWVADREHQALAALKPRGSPVLYAMEGNRVVWNVAGSLDNPATVTRIVDAWLAVNAEKSADKPQTVQQSSQASASAASATSSQSATAPTESGKPQ